MERKPQFMRGGIEHATMNGHRFHLRRNGPRKEHLLWIDGQSPPLALDRVAAEFASLIIQAMWKFQQGEGDGSAQVQAFVVDEMFRKYGRRRFPWLPARLTGRPTRERITSDLDRIFGTLDAIARGACPMESNLDVRQIDQRTWPAPARMDFAITYQCNLDCGKCYVDCGRKDLPELSTEDCVCVLEKLWQAGVQATDFHHHRFHHHCGLVPAVGRGRACRYRHLRDPGLPREAHPAFQRGRADRISSEMAGHRRPHSVDHDRHAQPELRDRAQFCHRGSPAAFVLNLHEENRLTGFRL